MLMLSNREINNLLFGMDYNLDCSHCSINCHNDPFGNIGDCNTFMPKRKICNQLGCKFNHYCGEGWNKINTEWIMKYCFLIGYIRFNDEVQSFDV